jgi:DNA-directed RNA polymerase specialized sigma subunit
MNIESIRNQRQLTAKIAKQLKRKVRKVITLYFFSLRSLR